jgi:hypothetical protein
LALRIHVPEAAMQHVIKLRLERHDAARDAEDHDEDRGDQRDREMKGADDVVHRGALSINPLGSRTR